MNVPPDPYCDVSLPVPLDRAFTYLLPESMWDRARAGCRVLVPFGARKLTGLLLRRHAAAPEGEAREALRLLDDEPVLDAELLKLGEWIASYYCAPPGEVFRTMTPLGGEMRRSKRYSLTARGRDAARQIPLGAGEEDPEVTLLNLLAGRPRPAASLAAQVPGAGLVLRGLLKKGLVEIEEETEGRDPLRSPATRLRVELAPAPPPEGKYNKAERELLAYLELHPGSHNLAEVERKVLRAAQAGRALARRGVLKLRLEGPAAAAAADRPPHVLNHHQEAAFQAIRAQLAGGGFHTFLLHGVTGSGKTEVYLRAIDTALEMGRGALLMVPEIGLTPAVAAQFFHRFGGRVAILHSAFSGLERAGQWRRIRSGEAGVVVGTRSGVFAPVRNLGLIIVDEEHDQSYKQEETPRYNGRDVAIVRAQAAGACVVLGSATPGLESRFNAARGKYTLLALPERVGKRPMPEVRIVDMRQEFLETRRQAVFSRAMIDAIRLRLEQGEQTMVLLNRRGFSSFAACRSCGARLECANCAVTLTYHRRDRRMLCHYCGYAERVPETCPKCASDHVYFVGTGSERVEDELGRELPRARVARMDRDTVQGKNQYEKILQAFRDRDFDILVGTQMIAKGHDIPNVTLVCVVSADVGLGMPDFRAAERTFQLLTQAAGRAGRGAVPGEVIIQTINPDHYAVRMAAAQDYERYYAKEIDFRRLMRYPPYSALANVVVRSTSQEEAYRMSVELGQRLQPPPEGMRVMGPAEAAVPKLKQEYRYQILIKSAGRRQMNACLRSIRDFAAGARWPATALVIDVDPMSLM